MQFLLLFSLTSFLSLFNFDGWRGDIQQPQAQQEALCLGPKVLIKVFLEGPFTYDAGTMVGSMKDNLRTNGASAAVAGYAADGSASIIPATEPYSTITGFTHVGGGGGEIIPTPTTKFAVTGNNAIVDWVFVELRNDVTPATIVATRSALIQADGDVVDVDGTSPITFGAGVLNCGSFHVAVRHRNHLGVRTATSVSLTNDAATTAVVDFTIASPAHGVFGTNARKTLTASGNSLVMYAGNVIPENSVAGVPTRQLKYNGPSNDRGPILSRIGGVNVNATVRGYFPEDTNMNSEVKYNGPSNDRAIILSNVGGVDVNAVFSEQL